MYISYTMVAALRDNRPVAYRDGIAIFGNIRVFISCAKNDSSHRASISRNYYL